MSTRELRRAEALGRVKSKTLGLTDAAKIWGNSVGETALLRLELLFVIGSCLPRDCLRKPF